MKIKAYIVSGKVSSNGKSAFDLYSTNQFGEKSSDIINYSLVEAFYLFKTGKLEFYDYRDKPLSEKIVEKKISGIDKSFKNNFLVFSDLRKKGYVVKSALKFGAVFRVYDKGKKAGKSHAKWIVFPMTEKDRFTLQTFASHNRVAHSTKKKVLIAVVDEENKITYFETGWIRP